MKTGLVLEGGGLRGIFTAGVLDVLMEEGVKFDGAVGVSAGAAFGSNYKSEQNRRAIRYNLRFAKDPRYSSIMSLIATGNLFNAQFCYHDIPEKLDPFDWEAFRKNPMEFYLVCTDVETGKAVYHLCDNDSEQEMLEWFRASGSMPLVSRIVEIGDKKLLDGGIADSIPLRFMEEQGYERNLVVLTRPANYVKTGNPLMAMIERGLRDYPEGVEAIRNRHIAYNEEVAYVRQREIGKYAFVIRPDRDLDIGRVEHDRTKIRAAYKAGRRKARKLLPEILTFLEGAKAGPAPIKASLVEEDVIISDVVKPSLVEDPAMISETSAAEGFGKAYEEHPEEISGRENKDIPEELFGKVKRDPRDGVDEDEFEGAPAPAADAGTAEADTEAADAGTAEADTEAADAAAAEAEPAEAKPAGVTSASLVESFEEEPAETAAEQDEGQKVRVQEVRAVILPEEEEELPAFQRPFPMDREPDQAAFEQEETENTEEAEATPAAEETVEEAEEAEAEETVPAAEETAEESEAEESEEAAPAVEMAEEAEEAEPEETVPAAEETAEESEAEESEEAAPAVEMAEEAEEAESEETVPAAEETAEAAEAEEPEEAAPAVEMAEEAEVAESEEIVPATEETAEEAAEPEEAVPAVEETAEEAEALTVAAVKAETEEPEAEEKTETAVRAGFPKKAKKKQKKVWKPGNMTALKESAKAEEKNTL